LGGGEPINASGAHLGSNTLTRTEEGMSIGYFYGRKTDGIFQTQTEIDNYVDSEGEKIQPNARPGDLKFVKLGDKGKLNEDDRTKIGNPFPKFTYGFTLTMEYKGFDVYVFFQGTQGNDVMNIIKYDLRSGSGWYNAPKDHLDIAWSKDNPSNTQFQINATSRENLEISDWYIEDGSYCRLKNLQLGYTLPKTLFGQKAKMQNIRLWVGAHNLLTFTKYSGLDPEMGSANPRLMGIDVAFYPQARTYLVGVNAKF
jgi:hypothetical protein